MSSKQNISANPNGKFYQPPANKEEVQSGYMYKSPAQTILMRSLKSWKRRYFVLSKDNANHHELKFFKDEKREKPLGQINIYEASLLYQQAESHPMWLWIERNFKCSASCVLYMKLAEKEKFLICENSSEMDDWFNAIFKALKTCIPTLASESHKIRSKSEPPNVWKDDQEKSETEPKSQTFPDYFARDYIYDYPNNMKYLKSEDTEEDDDDDEDGENEEDGMKINKKSETEEDTSYYMDMRIVKEGLRETQNKKIIFPQTILDGNDVLENSFLETVNEDGITTALNRHSLKDSEKLIPMEKDICVSKAELKNSMMFSEETGKLCVSKWRHMQSSGLFHEGDQILAINDMYTDSLKELQNCIRKLSKDVVKVTILRQPGAQPLSCS